MKNNFKLKSIKNSLRKIKVLSFVYNYLHLLKTKWIETKVLSQLKQMENLPEEVLYQDQNNLLIDILSYAYNNTVYYKQIFKDNNIEPTSIDDLKNIPFLTKEIIKKHAKDLISKEYGIESLGKRNTGGSTGEPLEFYCDTRAGLLDYGHHTYLYSLMGYNKGDYVLSCGGIEIDKNLREQNIYWLENRRGNVFGDFRFSVLYLNDSNINIYVQKLISIQPAILRGYPSFFHRLACYILDHDIKLDFKIKGINLTSEMCSTEQRITIEKAFSAMVYFEYGHNEVSLYCYTKDKTYTYQSSPIYGYIEVLNDDGTDTRIGEVGNIIATGFNNHGMPFIRYKTGDLGEISYRNGGIVHFSKIYGRTQDYILTKDNQKVFLTPLIFGQHLKAFANITKWQIYQDKIGEIDINIVKGKDFTEDDELDILQSINSVTDIKINFNYVKNIALTKRGKHLFLIQKLKH